LNLGLPRSFLDALPFGLILLDDEGKVLGINERAEQVTGTSGGELTGKNLFTHFVSIEGMRSAGESFLSGPGTEAAFAACFDVTPEGTPTEAKITLRRFEERGERFGIVIIEEAAGQGLSVNGLQAAATIRHDINNELMGLMGYVGLLEATDGLPDKARMRVRAIAERVDRIREEVAELGRIHSKGVESIHPRRHG